MMEPSRLLREERIEVIRILYHWYKEEVFRRREHMIRLTAFSSAFLVLLLITILALAPPYPMDPIVKILAMAGVVVFSALFIYLTLQQRDRHHLAKHMLIEIENVFGLYEQGLYLEGKTLYPDNWQIAWLSDRSVTVYVAVITVLTVLVIAAILAKG